MFHNKVEASIEGYYKKMENYLDYKSGAVLVMNKNIAEDVITTQGEAYGVELMLKKPLGKLNGWLAALFLQLLAVAFMIVHFVKLEFSIYIGPQSDERSKFCLAASIT